MTQILLTVLAMLLVAGSGLVVVMNMRAQAMVLESGKNDKRLDEVAAAVSRSIKRIPATDRYALPAPAVPQGAEWALVPSGIGMENRSTRGVPYLYCPIGRLSAAQAAALGALTSTSIDMPGSSYEAEVYGGLVVSSSLSLDSALVSQLRPLAIITAAKERSDAPPPCSSVELDNGVPRVDGGYVRVISEPLGVATPSFGNYGSDVTFWVADGASGTGQSPSEPASIDLALQYFVNYLPDRFTLNISGQPSASNAVWASFMAATADSGSALTFRGASSGARLSADGSGYWSIPARMTLENLTLYSPGITVDPGDRLVLAGTVIMYPKTFATIHVQPGGELLMENADFAFYGQNYGLRIWGKLSAKDSSVRGLTQSTYLLYVAYGRADLTNVAIGRAGIPASHSSIVTNEYAEFAADSDTTVGKSAAGECWRSINGDRTFIYSDQVNSGVPAETTYARPTNMDDLAAVEAWQIERAGRVRARRQNQTAMRCF